MRYVVTGGAGFIGSNIVKLLVKNDHEVDIIDNLHTGNKNKIKEVIDKVNFFKIDIRDKNSLEELWCSYNKLTLLPELPTSLREFSCNLNQLTIIPKLPDSLRVLFCYNNQLTLSPKLPILIEDYFFINNPVYDYIQDKCGGNLEIYHKENKVFANKIGEWFLKCKYNPKYKYCRDRVDKEYDKLF